MSHYPGESGMPCHYHELINLPCPKCALSQSSKPPPPNRMFLSPDASDEAKAQYDAAYQSEHAENDALLAAEKLLKSHGYVVEFHHASPPAVPSVDEIYEIFKKQLYLFGESLESARLDGYTEDGKSISKITEAALAAMREAASRMVKP